MKKIPCYAIRIIGLLLLVSALSIFCIVKFKLYKTCEFSLCTGHLNDAMIIPASLYVLFTQILPTKKLFMLSSLTFLLTRINNRHYVEFDPPLKTKGPFSTIISAEMQDGKLILTDENKERYTLTDSEDISLMQRLLFRIRRLYDQSKKETV